MKKVVLELRGNRMRKDRYYKMTEEILKDYNYMLHVIELINLELEEGEYNTLNGYIINQLGEIPKSNEKVEIKVDNVNIEVIKVSNKKIEKVKVSYIN